MHKNALEPRPAHGLAFHRQRGVRMTAQLRAGWRWLSDHEAAVVAQGETTDSLRVVPLVKKGVTRRRLG